MEGLFPLSRMMAGERLWRRGKGAAINFLDDHGHGYASKKRQEQKRQPSLT
jgi:hypothetical protein